jgi:hypothetical protein
LSAYKLAGSNGKPLGGEELSMLRTLEKGHGRIEKRTYYYSTSIGWMIDAKKEWVGLAGVGMVEREIQIGEEKTRETSYYIGSITSVKEFERRQGITGRSRVCIGAWMLPMAMTLTGQGIFYPIYHLF